MDFQAPGLVREGSFYRFLASQRGKLFRDEDFASLYHGKLGRPSVPPSILATALVLQTYDRVSDGEATERASFDLRWKLALGVALDEVPFAKSTLQLFRAHLLVHELARLAFERSLKAARNRGHLKGRMRLAVDTTNVFGRGAVKDTYNLLGDGIVLVMRALAAQEGMVVEEWAAQGKLERYLSGSSLKGEANLDWDDAEARKRLLREIVADADGLLEEVRKARGKLSEGSEEDQALLAAAETLSQVLLQDIDRSEAGPSLHEGVAKGRMPSVHDPEVRHGHKSASKRFDGHKAQIAVDTDSQIITAVAVLAGNAADNEGTLALVEASEESTEAEVAETVADCAFGDGQTRAAFAEAGRELVAKVPAMRNRGRFPKTAFVIDLEAQTCICPAKEAGDARYHKAENDQDRQLRGFVFATATCAACSLRSQCVGGRLGRTVQVHPQEALLQKARAFQKSPAFRPFKAARQVAEHRLARLVQLGIRQARYVGRAKTLFQLLMAATVANLTLIAGLEGVPNGQSGT
ncbi:MAG: IS1182 family transposase [Thermoflexaceae bacterium]|nr:IS1182 family transposase [Thermoflexaceae bacterium]